jgi:hypothetical protein
MSQLGSKADTATSLRDVGFTPVRHRLVEPEAIAEVHLVKDYRASGINRFFYRRGLARPAAPPPLGRLPHIAACKRPVPTPAAMPFRF